MSAFGRLPAGNSIPGFPLALRDRELDGSLMFSGRPPTAYVAAALALATHLCHPDYVKSQSQRDLEKHWAEQSKKQTPAERLRMKAEKLRKRIERDQALLERRRKPGEGSALQPAGQAASAAPSQNERKSSNSQSGGSARRKLTK
ncbi:MAG: hypothetical protein DMG64_16795 [Acidobacteria bacterium]|nr:MAG: hypothetical protein DMG64_16795 [Acidobacteriota bacterium]PYY24277.1 MAG: hypothetical protein DMG62_04530 [Acidobacteriota bacterium]